MPGARQARRNATVEKTARADEGERALLHEEQTSDIRLLLHMAHRNGMQAAVLEQWGITAMRGERDDPEQALTSSGSLICARE